MSFKTAPAANMAEIAAMVERREVGYSLESAFYASQEVYDLDIKAIFGQHWIFVASEAEIPDEGDFVTVEIDTQSIIVVRDATVGPESGTMLVSGGAKTMSSKLTPAAAAAICGNTIAQPCPMSVIAVRISIRPSASIRAVTGDFIFCSPEPVNPAP